jgi:hypothetical protein
VSGTFAELGYEVVPALVGPNELEFMKRAIDVSQRSGRMQFRKGIVPQGAHNEYSPLAGEALLKQVLPKVAAIAQCALLPAYAFARIYRTGAELRRHTDRNACEVSVSLTIFASPTEPHWPILVQDLRGTEAAVVLLPGDAIVYQGCNIPHWREPFAGEQQYQVFLHYVVKDGAKAEFAFDRRAGLKLDGLLSRD